MKNIGNALLIIIAILLVVGIIYYVFQLESITTCELGTNICYNGFGHKIYVGHWFGELSNMNFIGWGKQIVFYTVIPLLLLSPFLWFYNKHA